MLNKKMIMMIILATILFTKESLSQIRDVCTHGDVRLVGTPLRNLGVVEICIDSYWGRVCRDGWSRYDAIVVCNQLGFGRDGALALGEVPVEDLDSNFMSRFTIIDEVSCHSYETKLLNCPHYRRSYHGFWCRNGGDAGVRCTDKLLQVKNVTAATIQASYNNITRQSILLSCMGADSNASYRPSSFSVECINQQHHNMELSVNDGSLTQVNIGDLLSSTSFACCVSAIYYRGHYETERRCTSTDSDLLLDLFTTPAPNQISNKTFTMNSSSMIPASVGSETVVSNDLSMRANIIGGVLGSIIAILLLLLVVCGGALLYLLRSKGMTSKRKRSSQLAVEMPIDRNILCYATTDVAVNRNISYETVTTSTSTTASGAQAVDTVGEASAATEL